jgi:hypothetical protein
VLYESDQVRYTPGLIERRVLVLHIFDHLRGKHLFSTRYMSVSLAIIGTFDRSIALPVFNSQDKVVARCQGEILKRFILKREKAKHQKTNSNPR